MTNDFPKLRKKDLQQVLDWALEEYHKHRKEFHSYKECGNDEAALKCHNFSMCFDYMRMMIKYRLDEK